jgi:hypothetical protein
MQYSIFSMQVVMRLEGPDDALFRHLSRRLRAAPSQGNYAQTHDYYTGLCRVLRDASDRFERGVWDYWDDPSRAPSDFQDWVNGLTGQEARLRPAPEDGGPRYMACALAMLLWHHSASDQRLFKHCTIPESQLWKRDTFRELLKGPGQLNFLHVRSHLAYLLPGEDAALALTDEDLEGEAWHYLRPLE